MENTKNANFSTLYLMTLKEMRLERGIHQGLLAQVTGKSPNAWTKIENGQSILSADTMFSACSVLQIQPSYMVSVMEKLIPLFNQDGYYFQPGTLSPEEDELLQLTISYFNSKGYENLRSRGNQIISLTSVGNPFNHTIIPTLVRYCCNQDYRIWVDNGAIDNSYGYLY